MTELLTLVDLAGQNEQALRNHVKGSYNAEVDPSLEFLIAYESVGSWGCDSSSFFLLRDKTTGALYENHASHCSCYGFEGQWNPEPTTLEYLKSDKFHFCTGGYDGSGAPSRVKQFLQTL